MLKLRSLGLNDYSVLERQQRIGRIPSPRSACRRAGSGPSPSICPAASRRALQHSQGRVQGGLESLKAGTTPEQLAAVVASHLMLPLKFSWRSKARLSIGAAIVVLAMIVGFGAVHRPFSLFASRSAVSAARRRAAKTEFKAAWEALKASTTPSLLTAAYKAMNIRDDG